MGPQTVENWIVLAFTPICSGGGGGGGGGLDLIVNDPEGVIFVSLADGMDRDRKLFG